MGGIMTNVCNELGYPNVACIPSRGLAGGFCVSSKRGVDVRLFETLESGFGLSVNPGYGLQSWMLYCVYGTPYSQEKEKFWEEVTRVIQRSGKLWTMIEDLNAILHEKEKHGVSTWVTLGQCSLGQMHEIVTIECGSDSIELLEVQNGVCSIQWQELDTLLFRVRITCLCFFIHKLKYSFRFLEVWTSEQSCGDLIDKVWQEPCGTHHRFKVIRKMSKTTKALKEWNWNSFGFCDKKLKALYDRLAEKYFGNPFFVSARKRHDFSFLKNKILNRLEGWRAKQLSQAGRLTLIKSILSSIPCYTMAICMIPNSDDDWLVQVTQLGGENRLSEQVQDFQDNLFDAWFYVDASVVDNAAGIGVVLYRSGTQEAIALQSLCTVSSVLEAELSAIHTALERAWADNYQTVLIKSDSKVAVEALRLGELPLAWGSFPFIKRDLNSLADYLASQARVNHVSQMSYLLGSQPPSVVDM
ncbi:hypothetical protein G4B88_014950 [Cannabis sativa]|uniref:RNase H type-1 domain-containing protein n=1 Tax=Cannabis sativa TaxID=3483 RepID=A0A7J6DPD5_CANSA|nr:hypothetical protein G4B88_014950 [Cannabis sativa]